MQLFSRKKAFVALSLGALVALGACGDDVTVTEQPTPEIVSITPPSANMNVGESLNFSVTITGGNATTPPTLQSCTSSNPAVATATAAAPACRVTAVAAGNVTITALTTGGKQASASVTVAAPQAAIGQLTVSPSTASLAVNQTVTLVPNVNKAAAAVALTQAFTSSNTAIATVNATGVVTAVAPGVATITVSVTGTGTGYTTTTLTTAATVTVTSLPSGITSLNVQPTTLVMGLGTTAQLTASAQQPAGAAAATITYGTTVPSVATVNTTTGLVTAVAPGTAVITVTATSAANTNFAASTLTQLVPVTVSPSANVTIQTITQGPVATSYSTSSGAEGLVTSANAQVNQPVDITNVRDQIQVVLNLQPNGQRVDSVVVFIANADGTNRRPAARQLYSNGTANQGDITLFVNTADFTANFETGAADVFYPNGQKLISASVFTTQGTTAIEQQNAVNNRQTVNFNNLDGYAARYTSPSRSAIHATNNLTYWGGPGAEGTGSYAIVPVFYTPGRVVTRIDIGLREGLNGSSAICVQGGQQDRTFALGVSNVDPIRTGEGTSFERYTALPFNGTYNSEVGRITASTANTYTNYTTAANKVIECRGYSAPASDAANFVGVIAGTDNYNNPAPVVTRVDGYRFSAQVARIVANRLDYAGPSTVEPDIRRTAPAQSNNVNNAIWAAPAVTGWVNAAFNFQSQTAASTDAGIGLPATTSRAWRFFGCAAGTGGTAAAIDTASAAMPNTTGADIPECSSDNQGGWNPAATAAGAYNLKTRGPYTVGYTETDILGNPSFSPLSQRLGVDKTAPLIRFSAASAADTAWGNVTRSLQAEVIDERGGFIDSNDQDAVLRVNASTTYLLQPSNFGSFQHFATRGASSANPQTLDRASTNNVNCINPNSLTAMNTSTTNPFGNTTSTANGGTNPITNPSCPFINQGNNGATIGIFGALADGYRQATAVTFGTAGIYSYRARVFDRAGNVSTVLARSAAVDNGAVPTFGDLNVPASIVAAAAPVFGAQISDDVEARAFNLSLLWPTVGNRFIYPQTLLNARFNDEVVTPFAGNLSLPTGAPFITALETTTGAVPAFSSAPAALTNITNIVGTGFDVNNAASAPYTTSFGAVSLANLSSISGVNGSSTANSYVSWQVLNTQASLQPGFLAPAGLKAQLTGNTNVPNPPFSRVEFFRLNAVSGNYEYLGQALAPAQSDQGVTRFWTWTLTQDAYAKTPTALETTQRQVAVGDVIIAIGVRANGAGLSTNPAGTPIGGAAINLVVNGLPAGAAANVTFTNGAGFLLTATAAGTYVIPDNVVGTTLFASVANTTFNNQQYAGTSAPASAVAAAGLNTFTVTYALASTNIPVAVSGGVGTVNLPVNIAGVAPVVYNITGLQQATGTTQTYTVPQAGQYNVTGTAGTYGTSAGFVNGFAYTVAAPATSTVAQGVATPTVNLVYTNTTPYVRLTVAGAPAAGANVSTTCVGDGAVATTANIVDRTITASGANVCTTTAQPVLSGGTWYIPTVSGTAAAATNGANSTTVTYTAVAPRIRVTTSSIGGAPNNLPAGVPFTVRVTGGSYSTNPQGYTDFPAVSGTPLDITIVSGTAYNVSVPRQISLSSQLWQIAAAGDVTAAGGLAVGGTNNVIVVSGTAASGNAVVQNMVASGSPTVASDLQMTVNFGFTGPIP
ncbi:MAG TPA: Ig-like domain-containing protein [Gemmatimonas sp.]|uniref:Ig-like domain-containing protein n=1 Tax=Gemmatimonas sp. TaxID=1962908 RepID=UPI002EDBB4A0